MSHSPKNQPRARRVDNRQIPLPKLIDSVIVSYSGSSGSAQWALTQRHLILRMQSISKGFITSTR